MRALQMIAAMLLLGVALGADQPPAVKWSANDINGAVVNVPADRTSLVAFLRPEQEQSKQALKQIQATVKDGESVSVVMVVSVPLDPARIAEFAKDLRAGGAIVADPEFTASGKLN